MHTHICIIHADVSVSLTHKDSFNHHANIITNKINFLISSNSKSNQISLIISGMFLLDSEFKCLHCVPLNVSRVFLNIPAPFLMPFTFDETSSFACGFLPVPALADCILVVMFKMFLCLPFFLETGR